MLVVKVLEELSVVVIFWENNKGVINLPYPAGWFDEGGAELLKGGHIDFRKDG